MTAKLEYWADECTKSLRLAQDPTRLPELGEDYLQPDVCLRRALDRIETVLFYFIRQCQTDEQYMVVRLATTHPRGLR